MRKNLKKYLLKRSKQAQQLQMCSEKLGICLVWEADNKDNTLTNLRLLCPNCHSQTPTYCGRNRGYMTGKEEQETPTCPQCKGFKYKQSKLCRSCDSIARKGTKTKIAWPSNQALLALLKDNPYTTVAKSLGVSDNAIRKHLLKHPE